MFKISGRELSNRDAFPHRKDRWRCVTRRQLTGYAMSWRQQASRPIQRRSWTGRMPLRGVLRPSRLPERNRHAGDLWRPNACLMTVWRQGEPASSRKRRAKVVSAIVLARDRSLGANVNVRALQAAQPWAHNSAADKPASEPPHIRAAHSHINAEQLASAAPSHSASADKHPRTPTIGREAITEIQNLLSNSKVRNVIHSGRITFRVLTNYIPRLGELQSAVMANYNPRSQARPTP